MAGIGKPLRKKLHRAGLIEVPAEADDVPKLEKFLEHYFGTRTDVKPATLTAWGQALRFLVQFFGADKDLRKITAGDAEEWRLFITQSVNEVTGRKRSGFAKQFFSFAVKKGCIPVNPFQELKSANLPNPARMHFVTRETADRVIDACPSAEWWLMFALARYGGLRVPSETRPLRWEDVNWEAGRITITSPKTEHHPGGDGQVIPLFAELRPWLKDVLEIPEGGEYVFSERMRQHSNPPTTMKKFIRRAGEQPWPKPFHNLRSTRQTELEDFFPSHVVCAWLGNSVQVAKAHYLQVTDAHYSQALQPVNVAPQVATQVAASGPKTCHQAPSEQKQEKPQSPMRRDFMASDGRRVILAMEDRGLEPIDVTTLCEAELQQSSRRGGNTGGNISTDDPRLLALVSVWPELPGNVQAEILRLAHEALRRPGVTTD